MYSKPITISKQLTSCVRVWARFAQTEAGFGLGFGLRVNRIFVLETEDEVPYGVPTLRRQSQFFFGKYNTQSSLVPRTEKSVFNSTSG
jgi:hypothetical protein